jgi:hypothetical protein
VPVVRSPFWSAPRRATRSSTKIWVALSSRAKRDSFALAYAESRGRIDLQWTLH